MVVIHCYSNRDCDSNLQNLVHNQKKVVGESEEEASRSRKTKDTLKFICRKEYDWGTLNPNHSLVMKDLKSDDKKKFDFFDVK